MIPQEPVTTVYLLRRGTLYGAALGLVLGLINVSFQGLGEREAIRYWRDWILGGAFVGFVAGGIRATQIRPWPSAPDPATLNAARPAPERPADARPTVDTSPEEPEPVTDGDQPPRR